MNKIQIKQFEERLGLLESFVKEPKTSYSEQEIIDWISNCINLFYEIGVDSIIIRNFLDHFRSKTETVTYIDAFDISRNEKHLKINVIGPFHESYYSTFSYYKTGGYSLEGSFYYAQIAFASAKNVLKNKISEKRIAPFWLVEQMSTSEKTKHITTSLELIENKYESGDAEGLVTESITLLDSILSTNPNLKEKSTLTEKLNTLKDNSSLREEFGVSRDLVIGLNCGRIVRNEKIIHKNSSRKYDIPFLIATSFAYLVIFFTECVTTHGKVLNTATERE